MPGLALRDKEAAEKRSQNPATDVAVVAPSDASSEWGKAAAAHAARNRPSVLRKVGLGRCNLQPALERGSLWLQRLMRVEYDKRLTSLGLIFKLRPYSTFQALFKGGNLAMVILWGVSALLVVYISLTSEEIKVFDPYAVLQIPVGSEHEAIKKAYRAPSLQYHPDKNPDPAANVFFTENLTPAYKALTEPVARANYEKYGHPDGKQSVKLGIALPSWVGPGRTCSKHPSSRSLAPVS